MALTDLGAAALQLVRLSSCLHHHTWNPG